MQVSSSLSDLDDLAVHPKVGVDLMQAVNNAKSQGIEPKSANRPWVTVF
jgi:hypothetical protein